MAGRLFCHAGRDNIFLHGIWDSLFYTLLYARERVQEVYSCAFFARGKSGHAEPERYRVLCMGGISVKESRGQPKNGALKQAIEK